MPSLQTHGARRVRMGMAAGALVMAACSSDVLTVPNFNNPTPGGLAADPVAGIQLAANGLVFQLRAQHAGWISSTGIMGRESFNYTPTEGRSTTCWLGTVQDYACGAGSAFWGGYYTNLRNVFNFVSTVDATTLAAPQKDAARGFARTFEAYSLAFVAERGKNGGPTEVKANPTEQAPFVSQDSIYNFVIGRLDQGKTQLLAGGAAFPFTLNAGFTGFDTPASFLKFNRGLAARYNAERATLRNPACGANGVTCYQLALTNLAESFLNTANLNVGPSFIYSTASGDATNGLSNGASPFVVAHPSIATDAPLRAGGKDLRYEAKVVTINPPIGTGSAVPGIATNQDFKLYADLSAPIPMIRSEELILLRAEALWFTGQKANAIADIDLIRTTSGGIGPSTLTAGSSDADFVTELLLQRRYSLLFEGHRWVDVKRFNRLNTLPIDIPGQQAVYSDLLIPQAECLARKNQGSTLPPTCPP